ncbi:MAG: hypothetical protein KDC05_03365 [Bacteroidales bacterium]|nr:hypothetical protein [Bacteroidales bacterium]
MNKKVKSTIIWIFAFIFTVAIAVYQRMTGPTYPVRGKVELAGEKLSYRLVRSSESGEPADVVLKEAAEKATATIRFKRLNTNDAWTEKNFTIRNEDLVVELPSQPPAGKLEYFVSVTHGGKTIELTEEPVVIRFKGAVPDFILFPHILLMFLAMLFSTRTGIEALIKGEKTYSYTKITLVLFFLGGMILGPIVQKYAFDAFWTGWPFGQDLTDNKTLFAFIAWVIAYVRLRKNKSNRGWAIAASVILLLVYLIPHSMFGSELDYGTGEIGTSD